MIDPEVERRGTLDATEHHPAADNAYRWLKGFMVMYPEAYLKIRAQIEDGAVLGNRQAEACLGTIQRLKEGMPVSDRYTLGLAWTVFSMWQRDFVDKISAERLDPANPPTLRELRSKNEGE